ncbi:hypothetical protein OG897_13280 [Streptomyces sp. NBC_00237]|uniref:hypothetical protein n=1 Tax=Streptomyces sp. NBC_00237 TaxID=2975687 RepID=UPI0022514134|nr:hypothetical protein [Streptomyces sp. NBC_00237]MCX5202415.1 hypothetical protein [Streptomyces sp. NBC_00237]
MSRYRRIADREESEIAEADRLAHRLYGPDEDIWPEHAVSGYLDTLASIAARYPYNHRKEAA